MLHIRLEYRSQKRQFYATFGVEACTVLTICVGGLCSADSDGNMPRFTTVLETFPQSPLCSLLAPNSLITMISPASSASFRRCRKRVFLEGEALVYSVKNALF